MSRKGLPGVGEVAMQSGRHAGEQILRLIDDRGTVATPFRYRDLGSAAYICRGDAV